MNEGRPRRTYQGVIIYWTRNKDEEQDESRRGYRWKADASRAAARHNATNDPGNGWPQHIWDWLQSRGNSPWSPILPPAVEPIPVLVP